MTRADLIARVESAEGADRELDAAIVEWLYKERINLAPFYPGPINYDPRLWQERYGFSPTGSLDAAMMLVPEGVRTFLNIDGDTGITTAIVDGTQGCAATPALALVAACLRAGGE